MADASGSQFPLAHDHLQAAEPATIALGVVNETRAAVNAVEAYLLDRARSTALAASVDVDPGSRVDVVVVGAVTFSANDVLTASVLDDASPPALVVDGVGRPVGATVVVAVFNKDAVNRRTGRVCVHVDHV